MKTELASIIQINNLSNSDLIEFLKQPNPSVFSLSQLKTEFHDRFKNRLFQKCERMCNRSRLDTDTAKDIFQETFLKAFVSINKFTLPEELNDQHAVNKITKWLNKIALNLFVDYLSKQKKVSYVEEFNDEASISEEDEFDIELSFNNTINTEVILQTTWDSLTENERLVIIICIKNGCLQNKHMPDGILTEISKRLNVKKDSIRQIKLRALKKFRQAFPIEN